MRPVHIDNRTFRRALLSLNGLGPEWPADDPLPSVNPGSVWTLGMIRRMGFVQVDPIAAVERAHHHILFSRNRRYRHEWLTQQLEQERTLFENWTHDAAIIPSEFFPYWKHYFVRAKAFEAQPGYRRYFAPVTPADTGAVLRRIEREGPLKPRDFATKKVDWEDAYFAKPTIAKLAIELLWRTGTLAVARREGQQKVYDLARRVIPERYFRAKVSRTAYVDWACREALKRLAVASPAQISGFFDALSSRDAAAWCRRHASRHLCEVEVMQADGTRGQRGYALSEVIDSVRKPPQPPRGLRFINPFDPLIRDRQRTQRVFGFDYTVEIWVPPKKRRYGYYVLPILEGERFTGRVDAKIDRRAGRLNVLGLWWEPGIKPSAAREERLERELVSIANFVGGADIVFANGYARTTSSRR